jgi:hypothetical protein
LLVETLKYIAHLITMFSLNYLGDEKLMWVHILPLV